MNQKQGSYTATALPVAPMSLCSLYIGNIDRWGNMQCMRRPAQTNMHKLLCKQSVVCVFWWLVACNRRCVGRSSPFKWKNARPQLCRLQIQRKRETFKLSQRLLLAIHHPSQSAVFLFLPFHRIPGPFFYQKVSLLQLFRTYLRSGALARRVEHFSVKRLSSFRHLHECFVIGALRLEFLQVFFVHLSLEVLSALLLFLSLLRLASSH